MTYSIKKKQYFAIDIMKFLLAILLVCAHTSAEKVTFPIYQDIWFSLYIIAVPFFFTTSAYFFFRKIKGATRTQSFAAYKQYSKRILLMYVAWSVIYTLFIIADKWQDGVLSWHWLLSHLYNTIVFSSYPTIWFLPALWIGVSVTYLCLYRWLFPLKTVIIIALVLYIVGWIGYTLPDEKLPFISVNEWYISHFKTWRNGLFNGFIYAVLGAIISANSIDIERGRPHKISIKVFILLVFVVLEALITKRFINSRADANYLFMLIPFTYYFVSWLLTIQMKPRAIYLSMRNLSLLIFLSQRIFLTAIPALVPVGVITCISRNPYVGLFIFLSATLLFSIGIILVSKKIKIFKMLW